VRGSQLDRSTCDRSLNNFITLGLGAALRASVRRHRRAHDVRCDDGKELESSIDFRNGQRCSISGAVNQTYVFFSSGWSPAPKRFPLPFRVKERGKEINVRLPDVATGFLTLVASGGPGSRRGLRLHKKMSMFCCGHERFFARRVLPATGRGPNAREPDKGNGSRIRFLRSVGACFAASDALGSIPAR